MEMISSKEVRDDLILGGEGNDNEAVLATMFSSVVLATDTMEGGLFCLDSLSKEQMLPFTEAHCPSMILNFTRWLNSDLQVKSDRMIPTRLWASGHEWIDQPCARTYLPFVIEDTAGEYVRHWRDQSQRQ